MASKSDSRRVSANVAVFIISFLVFTTLIVFAVLLFLSYENMLRMLSYEVTHGTRTAAQGLAIDIETVTGSYDNEFVYTVDNDGSAAFKNSRIVDRFINSNLYNNFNQYRHSMDDDDAAIALVAAANGVNNFQTKYDRPVYINKNADTAGREVRLDYDQGRRCVWKS